MWDRKEKDRRRTEERIRKGSGKFVGMGDRLIIADLVHLRLQVLDDLLRHLVAQNLKQINPLVAGNRLVRSQFNALLHVLDLGVPRDQVCVLGLSDRLVRKLGSLALRIGHSNAHHRHDHSTHESHFHFRFFGFPFLSLDLHGNEGRGEVRKRFEWRFTCIYCCHFLSMQCNPIGCCGRESISSYLNKKQRSSSVGHRLEVPNK